jgi:hypothetical protein
MDFGRLSEYLVPGQKYPVLVELPVILANLVW